MLFLEQGSEIAVENQGDILHVEVDENHTVGIIEGVVILLRGVAVFRDLARFVKNDVIDKATIEEYLQGNYDGETVLNTVNKILEAYDYSEKFEKAAGVEPLKENRILNGKLMLRLKAFCFIMISDKKYSIFLRNFLKENPHFVSIIEEFDRNSEHNKQVEFEKNDYENLNEKMLGLRKSGDRDYSRVGAHL